MLFVVNVGALYGNSIISDFDASFTVNQSGIPLLDFLTFVANNFSLFFTLMTVSSDLFLVGSVMMASIAITFLYIGIEVFRGV